MLFSEAGIPEMYEEKLAEQALAVETVYNALISDKPYSLGSPTVEGRARLRGLPDVLPDLPFPKV